MNKMKRNGIILLAWALALTACSTMPKVIADVTMTLPPRPADSVAVYEVGADAPQNAVEIGKVRVTDGGMTPDYDCLYNNILSLAVKKTAESGGNGLRIDKHKEPSFWSSTCHRIWGTMLLLPDGAVKTGTLTTLQEIERKKDAELKEEAMKQLNRVKQTRNTPENIVKVNFGFSGMLSKFYLEDKVYSSKTGFDYSVAYQHLWQLIGFELNFESASFRFNKNYKNSITCFGPSLVLSQMFGKKFRYDFHVGVNFAHYEEKYYGHTGSENHAIFRLGWGLEYMLSKHLGLGVEMDYYSLKLNKPDDFQLSDNEFYGINRLNLTGGLRCYF